MRACKISPVDRQQQVRLVGNDLLNNYGKKNFYTVQEVKEANRRQGIGLDVGCWSHATFNTHRDFDACDYVAMKGDMLASVSNATDSSWFDVDLSWLEFPDIDLSLFDFLDF